MDPCSDPGLLLYLSSEPGLLFDLKESRLDDRDLNSACLWKRLAVIHIRFDFKKGR